MLPPSPDGADEAVARLDAVIFAGGADLDPAMYDDAPPHPATTGIRPDRDAGALPLLQAALRADLPVLGICRGMQLLAVAHGGTLEQHLPDTIGHERHRPSPGVYGMHEIHTAEGSLVRAVVGERVVVPSYHHQGLATPGTLTVTGWADDETPEVVEDPARRFALGVLWHPRPAPTPACSKPWWQRPAEIATCGEKVDSARLFPHRSRSLAGLWMAATRLGADRPAW